MDKRRLEWRVGLFVFIGLVLLAVLLLQFSKGTSWFRSTYNLYLTARNVGGLKVRGSVLMSGVQIGTVSDIRLNPSGTNVTITLRLLKPYVVHQDARFLIEQSGFSGTSTWPSRRPSMKGASSKRANMRSRRSRSTFRKSPDRPRDSSNGSMRPQDSSTRPSWMSATWC